MLEYLNLIYKGDEETKIWRYLDFPKFVSLIHETALCCTRSDCFSDKYEGVHTRLTISKRRTKNEKQLRGEALEKELTRRLKTDEITRRATYVNCWHINDEESLGMWELYSEAKSGIAIKTSVSRLLSSLMINQFDYTFVKIGRVVYGDHLTDDMPDDHALFPFLFKRKALEHEKEARLILIDKNLIRYLNLYENSTALPDTPRTIKISVDLNELIEEIIVSPYAEEWIVHLVDSLVKEKVCPLWCENLCWIVPRITYEMGYGRHTRENRNLVSVTRRISTSDSKFGTINLFSAVLIYKKNAALFYSCMLHIHAKT